MPLIVQDGTGQVANAYAYADEATIIEYAAARGITVAEDDATRCGILAMDYLEVQDYKGRKTTGEFQGTQFPREGVQIGCTYFPSDEIPQLIINAHCEAAMLVSQGIELQPNTAAEQVVKREKIGGTSGAIETEYFAEAAYSPTTPRLDALLAPLLNVGFQLQSIRA